MAEALILDSEAVNALAHASERAVLAERSRAILRTRSADHVILGRADAG